MTHTIVYSRVPYVFENDSTNNMLKLLFDLGVSTIGKRPSFSHSA